MSLPKIGQPTRGSTTGRPIMVLLDALGRRGALRILWELRTQSMTFRALQDACDSNPGSLNTRIKELRSLGVVDHEDGGYHLTDRGRQLVTVLNGLQAWVDDWSEEDADA